MEKREKFANFKYGRFSLHFLFIKNPNSEVILINDHNKEKEQFQFLNNDLIGMPFQLLKIIQDHEYKQENFLNCIFVSLESLHKRKKGR